ncbi:MAG: MBL fold metallo-hydrolase [Lachnospiraceae bacterium]|nr:MBL fold metallo-hydrolase [Lachnospiraceae bacterium]
MRFRRLLSSVIAAAALIAALLFAGTAKADGEVQIGTWSQLLSAAQSGNSYSGQTLRLTADITAPAGAQWPGFTGFAGTFAGDGHFISGIKISTITENTAAGLFNTTSGGAVIRDLILKNSTVTGVNSTGAIVGKASGSITMEAVRVADDVTVTAAYQFGGLIGRHEGSGTVTIRNCWSAAAVTSAEVGGRTPAGSVGGLIGWVHAGSAVTITGCCYSGALTTSTINNYGGIVGTIHATQSSNAYVRIVSSVAAFSFLPETGGRRGGLIGGANGSCADYITIELVNDYSCRDVAVGDNAQSAISDTDLNYLTPNTAGGTINTTTKFVAFQAQLMGYALASKTYNFNGKTLNINNDIDMTGWGEWPMFGSTDRYFIGSINGGGNTVSGLHVNINSDSNIPAGFVSMLYLSASVSNMTIADSSFVNNTHWTGAAAGRVLEGASITGVHVTSDVTVSGYDQVGGICGSLKGTVSQCWSEAQVSLNGESTGYRAAGGIAGTVLTTGASIDNCLFTGSVSTEGGVAGGILGATRNDSCYVDISGCVSAGSLYGAAAGGILGDFSCIYRNNWQGETYPQIYSISDCYAAPATKPVGTLSVGFTDSFVTNTSVYTNVSSLYGSACSRLSGSVWTQRQGNIPVPTAFYDAALPVVSGGSFTETDFSGCRSIRDAFGDVPVPADSTFNYEQRLNHGCYSFRYTYNGQLDNPFPAYISALENAGFTMVSGSGDTKYTWNKDVFAAVFTKGDRILLAKRQHVTSGDLIWVGVYPALLEKTADPLTLFSGVPGVGGQTPEAVDYGAGNWQKTYTGVSKSNYDSLCASLISGGFTKAADNGSGLFGTVFTSSYQKDSRTVTVMFTSRRSEIYVSIGQDEPLSPHLNDQASWSSDNTVFDSTVMVMPGLNTNGNSFVIRLKNGHFIINDGGNVSDSDALIALLERMTPAGGIPVVDGWFISHGHIDHCAAIYKLSYTPALRERIRVNGIYYSEPSAAVYAIDPDVVGYSKSMAAGASLLHTETGAVTPLYRCHTGERYYFSDISVDILFTQEQLPLGEYGGDYNDSSTSIVLNIEGDKVLLAGDTDTGTVRRLVGFNSLGLDITSFYTQSQLTFKMRSLLHHGHNESTTFVNGTNTDVLLLTTVDPDRDAEIDANTYGNAYSYAKTKASELIRCNADRWMTFPYALGSYQTSEDISAYRSEPYTAPEAPDGKVFAGWFWDTSFTSSVGEDTVSGSAFAKFVDEDVLQVMYQQDLTQYANGSRKLRIVTSVDSLNYKRVGFELTYKNSSGTQVTRDTGTSTVYRRLNWFRDETEDYYDPSVFSPESRYFCGFRLTASDALVAKNPAGISVQAYWITLDGTRVVSEVRDGLLFAGQEPYCLESAGEGTGTDIDLD